MNRARIRNACSFCNIIAGKLPSHIVYEDKNTLAFAPLKKDVLANGHMIVATKKHNKNIYDIPTNELNAIIIAIKSIAKSLKRDGIADGINLLHASGSAAQQSVPHFHIHLIPRIKGDGLDTWPKTGYKDDK